MKTPDPLHLTVKCPTCEADVGVNCTAYVPVGLPPRERSPHVPRRRLAERERANREGRGE